MKLLSGMAVLVASLLVGAAAALAVPVPAAPPDASIVTVADRQLRPEREFAPRRQKLGGPTQKLGKQYKPRRVGSKGGHSHGGSRAGSHRRH